MGFISALTMAHRWITERVTTGSLVIDATAGGGVDTLALAQLVGVKGTVLAFDIQQEALDKTATRLQQFKDPTTLATVSLICDSHANMGKYVDQAGTVGAIMFNLGYFPGGDESIITIPSSTIEALEQSLELLKVGGIITCMLYPGHTGGDTEADVVQQWASKLPVERAQCIMYRQLQRQNAPYLIGIEKRS
ncbi:class I SAM-dependent methyltransferase [Paenibacillus endoradicis]|uniref:class I SAM-dependent methyltransferase n=1 Tax=Paenibacillus endoradicis TaxID=2972487 RepID=UPI002159987D|nr:class I SAM-dependent methyltransferase [Paenibacillus endoradicis]MCR8657886.1 16S rRNA (cytosine(1402)-N(4))-methyltransferase [Paenibacillus endoradicis]